MTAPRIAAERGVPLREVYDAVHAAYARAGAVETHGKNEHGHH